MDELFASGRIVDLILALMALEAGLLWLWRRRTGRGPRRASLLTNLAAGGCLLLALRAVLTGGSWTLTAVWLAAALVAHLADLRVRWQE